MPDGDEERTGRPRLTSLLRSIPDLVRRLIRDEVRSARDELTGKLKAAGVGAGLTVGGGILALFALGALVTAAIDGLDLVVPRWLAALIVAGALLLLAATLVIVGVRRLRTGVPPLPTDSLASVKEDILAVKGTLRTPSR
ncbi:MAG: phage holin family protein [Micrococcales bacterium]|nr:phage holin family protein [Micrococcales bacterium]